MKLEYSESGEGLPVFLLHGFPFDNRIWRPQVSALHDVARLIAPDLPGFGKSQPLPDGTEPSMDAYAKGLADFASGLNLDKVVLVGHSMSGYISLAFARLYPEKLAGLVLVTTKPGADTRKAREGRMRLAARVQEIGAGATVDAMHSKLLSPDASASNRQVSAELREIMVSQGTRGIVAAILAMASRPSSTAHLGDITAPTLVIGGSRDAIIPARTVREMARRIPGARYMSIHGVGHMPMLEAPEQFNAVLRPFLCDIQQKKPTGCA